MNTPNQNTQVPTGSSSAPQRKALFTIVIILAIAALGWFIYKKFIYKMTPEEYREYIMETVSKRSPALPPEVTQPVMEQVAKNSTPTKGTPTLTEKQKMTILQSVSQ